jgi:hypothetical protein
MDKRTLEVGGRKRTCKRKVGLAWVVFLAVCQTSTRRAPQEQKGQLEQDLGAIRLSSLV